MDPVKTTGKILIKAVIIGFIILILQLPAFYVTNLIEERESRQKEAIEEVSSKWAGRQNIIGPIVVVPYWQYNSDTTIKDRSKQFAYFLPDNLQINAKAIPEERYRGIYKVILYSAELSISGNFGEIHPENLNIPVGNILWNEAFIQLNVSDPKGLNEEINITCNNKKYNLIAQNIGDNEGMSALLGITSQEELQGMRFSTLLSLNGSQQLLFTPIGKTTMVNLSSKWPHPSFTGDILPQSQTVKDSGFSAKWKSLAFKRSAPQQWKGTKPVDYINQEKVAGDTRVSNLAAPFGADFFIPVNAYQKTMRSVKYSMLCIVLTFAFFFIIENNNKKSVHPFQYGLIGIALILFYILLLSFAEYTGFNIAYIISSLSVIGLIGWFVKGVLGSTRLAAILSIVLILTYTYVFTILQLQDFALILGSVGLFITLGIIMYFSRKIKW